MVLKIGCGALVLSSRALDTSGCPVGKKQILLFQRGPTAPTYPLYWGAAGGLHEEGETLGETAAREAKEEGNILFLPDEQPYYTGMLLDREVVYFTGDWSLLQSGIVFNDGEAVAHGWFTFEEAVKLKLSFKYREAIIKLRGDDLL